MPLVVNVKKDGKRIYLATHDGSLHDISITDKHGNTISISFSTSLGTFSGTYTAKIVPYHHIGKPPLVNGIIGGETTTKEFNGLYSFTVYEVPEMPQFDTGVDDI